VSPQQQSCDVVVWGGGTGGVAAALQSARGGAQTLLLTPGAWLGGMVSAAGVCCPDGNELSPWQTGLWGAFLRELERREPEGLDHNWVSCFGYKPDTAESILQDWVKAEPLLQWWPDCRLNAVKRHGLRVSSLLVERATERWQVDCEVVVDGSDRGDLLPLADAPFRLGWEAHEQWNEPSAPSRQRLETDSFFADQPVQSPTWVVMGQLASNRMPQVPLATGRTSEFGSPSGLFRHCLDDFGLERTLTYGRLPGGLVMLNWPLDGNDWHEGLGRGFCDDAQNEADLFAAMQSHSLQFAALLQEKSHGWLQLGRAFPESAKAPAPWLAAMPYWREGRRCIGRRTVIEQDLLPLSEGPSVAGMPKTSDGEFESIAVGNYANDHHYPGPDWPLAAKSCRWGGRWTGTPFCIPYGALLSNTIANLISADKGISTSHMANGATRLQPLVLNVGQAAGMAAALAVRASVDPDALSVRHVQEALIQDPWAPAAVVPLWSTPWHHPQWQERQLAALDDPEQALALESAREVPLVDLSGVVPQAGGTHASQWSGDLHPDAKGGFELHLASGECWPLITLEPSVHHWLMQIEASRPVQLLAVANPWGPWLRVTGVL